MPSNPVEICNAALSLIGKNPISSLGQAVEEARKCAIFFPLSVLATLNDHDWGFARGWQNLTVVDEEFPGWRFVYAAPSDMVAARFIFNPNSKDAIDKIPYELGSTADGNRTTVLTDYPQPKLVYTKTISNATLFDAQFVEALSWNLAGKLAVPLKADAALASNAQKTYSQAILQAKARNANQQSQRPSERSSFVDSR